MTQSLPRKIASKAELRQILREAGLAKAAAERIADAGWPAISPEGAAAELAAKFSAATQRMKSARLEDAPGPLKDK